MPPYVPKSLMPNGFYAPQRRLGSVGRAAVSRMERSTTGKRIVSAGRNAMNYRGRGLARNSDLMSLEGGDKLGVNRMRANPQLNRRSRVDINFIQNKTNGKPQLRATAYNRQGQAMGPGGAVRFTWHHLNWFRQPICN